MQTTTIPPHETIVFGPAGSSAPEEVACTGPVAPLLGGGFPEPVRFPDDPLPANSFRYDPVPWPD